MKNKLLLLIIASIFLWGCREGAPLEVPAISEVAVVKVTGGGAPKGTLVNKITDRKQITNILAFINENNTDWYRPIDTFPTPQFTIWFENERNENILVLWLGSNWLGGEPEPKGPLMPQLRKLDKRQNDEIRNLLGV